MSLIGARIKYRNNIGRVLYYAGNNRFYCEFGNTHRMLRREDFEVVK